MLYHNGYVVKDLIENEDLLINHSAYRGVQSYHNWPLAREQDPVSKELTREVDHEFEKNGYVEILGDTELLKKYVAHCKKCVQKRKLRNNYRIKAAEYQ